MTILRVRQLTTPLQGRVRVPGDKSISHRAVLFGALAEGTSEVRGFLPDGDCEATCRVVRALGVTVEAPEPTLRRVHGRGLLGLREPSEVLDCANSGTTLRLLLGLLAGQPFAATVTGTPQLCSRPMGRVSEPLRRLGARVLGRAGGTRAPLTIEGGGLSSFDDHLPIASAQVKSALLLAGLYAPGGVRVREPGPSRDHSEVLLRAMGAPLEQPEPRVVSIRPPAAPLLPLDLDVPGDASSAAFLLVLGALGMGELLLEGVGVNPTRTGLLDALLRMHAAIETRPVPGGLEPRADLLVRGGARLQATELAGEDLVRAIDEVPILAVAATQAEGVTTIRDAQELRVKETDRIAVTARELRKLGAAIEELPDGLRIEGPTPLRGATVESQGDHRLALALAVAGLVAEGETTVRGAEVTDDSFPGFVPLLRSLGADVALRPEETP